MVHVIYKLHNTIGWALAQDTELKGPKLNRYTRRNVKKKKHEQETMRKNAEFTSPSKLHCLQQKVDLQEKRRDPFESTRNKTRFVVRGF